MNLCFQYCRTFPKAVSFFLLLAALLTIKPLNAQKSSPHAKTLKKSTNRVIYGLVSFYHNKFQNRPTASGELFNQNKFTCACNMLPLGTWVEITNLSNGKSVIVKVNDRLHPRMRRIADLSKIAARRLGYLGAGVTRVKVEVIGKTKPL